MQREESGQAESDEVPSEEYVAELRRKLEESEAADKNASGKKVPSAEREKWQDELDQMRAESEARHQDAEDGVFMRRTPQHDTHRPPETDEQSKPQAKKVDVEVEDEPE